MDEHNKLLSLIDAEIQRFKDESEKHKRIHRRCQLILIALTALSAIISGSGLLLPDWSKQIEFLVLVTTTLATALTAWAEMRHARELWQHEREVYYALKDVRREIDFVTSFRSLQEDELTDYFQRINRILGSSGQKWSRIQEKKDS